jgi:hypothetical protein
MVYTPEPSPLTKFPWEFDQPLCAEIGVEAYYIEDEDDKEFPRALGVLSQVKKLCGSCVHQPDCAEWGIRHERYGLWGGLNPQERHKIRRQRNIFVHDLYKSA